MFDPTFRYSDKDFDDEGKFIFPEIPDFKCESDKNGNILNVKEFRSHCEIKEKKENLAKYSEYQYGEALWRNFDLLSPVQQKAVRLLVSGHNMRDTARECNINEATLYRWLQLNIFAETIKLWQQRLLIETDNKLKSIVSKALERLEYVLDNPQKFEGREYLRAIEISLGFLNRGSK
jgi:transposase-like protein